MLIILHWLQPLFAKSHTPIFAPFGQFDGDGDGDEVGDGDGLGVDVGDGDGDGDEVDEGLGVCAITREAEEKKHRDIIVNNTPRNRIVFDLIALLLF